MNGAAAGSFLRIEGSVMAVENVSAVAKFRSFLVIGSDEAVGADKDENYVQVLGINADDSWAVQHDILLAKGGKELDIEGICEENDYLYVVGSHSSKRKKTKPDNTYRKNRETFHQGKVEEEKDRDWLHRVKLGPDGSDAGKKERISLRKIIDDDPVLKLFSRIPSKENGVDVEGIAVKDGWLHLGFRGPVFRENYVPVMRLRFDDPEGTCELLYVQLGGRGIRDLASVSDGFLILAGPVGDGSDSYQICHWDGRDLIPGRDRKPEEMGSVRLLGEVRPPSGAKVEGMALMEEQTSAYQLVIAYDGARDKNAVLQRFVVDKA